ncbi:MAG: CvpA family protein [Desulfovibrio sp.]|nr:MAG: CvpA family protein [Desulfovibrio sp.]
MGSGPPAQSPRLTSPGTECMNVLDIAFLIVTGFFALRGLYRGLLIEVASLLGLVGGFFLANAYYMDVADLAKEFITNRGWAEVVSYLLIFIGCIVLVTLVAKLLKKLLIVTLTAWLDHAAGLIIGLAKGAVICCVALLVLQVSFSEPYPEFMEDSQLRPHLNHVADILKRFLPEELP